MTADVPTDKRVEHALQKLEDVRNSVSGLQRELQRAVRAQALMLSLAASFRWLSRQPSARTARAHRMSMSKYRYWVAGICEGLTKKLLECDSVTAEGSDKVRQARRSVVRAIQTSISDADRLYEVSLTMLNWAEAAEASTEAAESDPGPGAPASADAGAPFATVAEPLSGTTGPVASAEATLMDEEDDDDDDGSASQSCAAAASWPASPPASRPASPDALVYVAPERLPPWRPQHTVQKLERGLLLRVAMDGVRDSDVQVLADRARHVLTVRGVRFPTRSQLEAVAWGAPPAAFGRFALEFQVDPRMLDLEHAEVRHRRASDSAIGVVGGRELAVLLPSRAFQRKQRAMEAARETSRNIRVRPAPASSPVAIPVSAPPNADVGAPPAKRARPFEHRQAVEPFPGLLADPWQWRARPAMPAHHRRARLVPSSRWEDPLAAMWGTAW